MAKCRRRGGGKWMKYRDQPLGSPEVRRERRGMLGHPRIEKLTRRVEDLRVKTGWDRDIPYFDPLDGGVDAEVLFLFESPGDGALASGFVSRDNKDPSAAMFTALNEKAKLRRELTASWNTVPWALGRSPTREDLTQAEGLLGPTLDCFDSLTVVVLSGKKAQTQRTEIEARGIEVLEMPHPSPNSLRFRPERKEEILRVLGDCRARRRF